MARDWQDYEGSVSEGTIDWRKEGTGTPIDLLSPREQGLDPVTTIHVDGEDVDVPTPWRLVLIGEDGSEWSWRWPSYGNDARLGLNVLPKEYKFSGSTFFSKQKKYDPKKVVSCGRTANNRNRILLIAGYGSFNTQA